MDAQMWLIIAIVGFSLAGIALITAIIMFIKLNIPAVIGDLSGRTVAREIKAMRDANASSGNKIHRSSSVNANRGRLTEKADIEPTGSVKAAAHASKRLDITNSGQSAKLKNGNTAEQISKDKVTEALSSNVNEVNVEERRATDVLESNKQTDVLRESTATDLLIKTKPTEVLSETRETEILSETQQTEVLSENSSVCVEQTGTTVLNENVAIKQNNVTPVAFKVTRSVMRINTEEKI